MMTVESGCETKDLHLFQISRRSGRRRLLGRRPRHSDRDLAGQSGSDHVVDGDVLWTRLHNR